MKIEIYRFYCLLLPVLVIQECVGQTALLTLVEDKCITNTSSAMAMIYNLSDLIFRNGQLKPEVSQFKVNENDKGGIKGSCSIFECFGLTHSQWKLTNSLTPVTNNLNNLVTDRRWEDFLTFGTHHTKQYGELLQYLLATAIPDGLNNFTIPFSLQVKEEAHIFLCDGNQVPKSNCYWFMLQAWRGQKTAFRKCRKGEIQKSYNDRAPTGLCSNSTVFWEHKSVLEILSEDRWKHFKIVKTGDEYKLTSQNGSVIFTVDTSDFVKKPQNLFFHTKTGTGLWKVHNFSYFYTDEAEAILQTRNFFSLMKGRNCLSLFVAMCKLCSIDIHFCTLGHGYPPYKEATVKAEDEQWMEVKICVNMTERRDDVFLRIISKCTDDQNVFWAFSNLRASNTKEIRVLTPAYPEIWKQKCQFIRNGAVLNLTTERMSTLENWKKCKEQQFGEDCLECNVVYKDTCPRKTKYCQLIDNKTRIQHKCYCSIGSEGENCQDCTSFNYGHGCINSCKNCQDGCDAVSGICKGEHHFCLDRFVGDKCDLQLEIFIFDNLPVVEIRPTSCYLSVKSFNGKYHPAKPPLFYNFQYKEISEADWKNVTQKPQEFNISTKVHLQNLKFKSTYSIRVFGFNSHEDLKNFHLISNSIPFQNITTTCYESMATEEIPELDAIIPRIEDVAFRFRMLQCEQISGPFYVDGDIRGMEPWCNRTIFLKTEELTGNNLVMKGFKPYCNYSGILRFYRKSENIQKKLPVSFETLESVPNEISQLEVTSKGIKHISLRWLPPYPPTGLLSKYKIVYCYQKYWNECNDFQYYEPVEFDPKPCKLWPDYHCYTFTSVKEEHVYTVKVESRNKGNDTFSNCVTRIITTTDDKRISQPPYGSTMSWTEENDLFVTWYHPNATGGILKGFRVYVNNVSHDCELSSEEEYHLIYNITIKSYLPLPDLVTVGISAFSLAGESNRTIIAGQSPPPIPNEIIKNIVAKDGHITITFDEMTPYKKSIKRFLYVLITKCDGCEKYLQSYRDDLLSQHRNNDWTMRLDTIQQHHWKAIKTYNDLENDYPKKLKIEKNSWTNSYLVKPNTKYTLAFIWVYKFGGYVRLNYTVVSTDESFPLSPISTTTTIVIISVLALMSVLLITSITALVCLRVRRKHNATGASSATSENDYANPECFISYRSDNKDCQITLPASLNTTFAHHGTSRIPDIICPGDPTFKTTNSKRIQLKDFQQYVENGCATNELLNQYQVIIERETKLQNQPDERNFAIVALHQFGNGEYWHHSDATYVDGYKHHKAYIAMQDPRNQSLLQFWQTVWQENVTYILMMNPIDIDKKNMKQYWPDNGNKQIIIDDFKITFFSLKTQNTYGYTKFNLCYKESKPRKIHQIYFKEWPEQGIPKYSKNVVPILKRIQSLSASDFPIVVHCRDGVGKTGTLILCDICLRMAKAEGVVDVLAMLEHLRNQKANMVDTAMRYKFAHFVISNYLLDTKM